MIEPTQDDVDVRDLVMGVLSEFGSEIAEVSFRWEGGGAQMWFTRLTPRRPDAASVAVGFEPGSLNITVADTWFEALWPDDREFVQTLLRAVFDGSFEQAGWRESRVGRITIGGGHWTVGALQLPWPWRLRRVHRFAPYT